MKMQIKKTENNIWFFLFIFFLFCFAFRSKHWQSDLDITTHPKYNEGMLKQSFV